MKKILYIDGCIRRTTSRTERLAQAYLQKRQAEGLCCIETVILEDLNLQPLTEKGLALREKCIANSSFSDPIFNLAHQFLEADELVEYQYSCAGTKG